MLDRITFHTSVLNINIEVEAGREEGQQVGGQEAGEEGGGGGKVLYWHFRKVQTSSSKAKSCQTEFDTIQKFERR